MLGPQGCIDRVLRCRRERKESIIDLVPGGAVKDLLPQGGNGGQESTLQLRLANSKLRLGTRHAPHSCAGAVVAGLQPETQWVMRVEQLALNDPGSNP